MKLLSSGTEKGIFPLESELAWQRDAACRGLGVEESRAIFFPAPGESISAARALCGRCTVTQECLEFALAHGCIGVWGGTTDNERRRIRRRALTASSA